MQLGRVRSRCARHMEWPRDISDGTKHRNDDHITVVLLCLDNEWETAAQDVHLFRRRYPRDRAVNARWRASDVTHEIDV